VLALRAEYQFSTAEWAVEAQFATQPGTDVILTATPEGDAKAIRFFLEQAGEHYLLIRFSYPMALLPGSEFDIYQKSVADLLRSRPGQKKVHEKYTLGAYGGERLVIAQPKEKSVRELRLIVVGSCLYVLSAEWPAASKAAADHAASFLQSIKLRADYEDARQVETRERWREFTAGRFKVRYDASRWYRDPADAEPGIFNFLRNDKAAEAQFIAEEHPVEGGDIEKAVIATAQEGAQSVSVKKRGKKLRGAVQVLDLEFAARVEDATYVNHGYFYSGPEGTVQLRAWAKEQEYLSVTGDIAELLDGLTVTAAK
jgi:hypothetical protein